MIRDDDLVEVELFIEELKDTKPEGECATQLCDMLNRAVAFDPPVHGLHALRC